MGCVIGLVPSSVDAAGSTPDLDPLVAEIVEMLKAGVEESVITRWLESTGRKPAELGSREIIALAEAGASEKLITKLLQWLEDQGNQAATEEASLSLDGAESRDAGMRNPAAEPSLATGSLVTATFGLRAKQMFTDEDEPDRPREPPWNVYLYLDGELVSWAKPDLEGERVEARRFIEPGHREVRVILQRYEELRDGWSYESLSVPTLIDFEARTGDPLEIDVEIKRIWGLWRDRKEGGPMSYVIRQGDEVLAESPGTGGNPDRWQPICEDVEANFADDRGVPKRFRGALKRCVRWIDLWLGAGRGTSRSAMLAEMAQSDFRPPVQ